MLDVCRQEYVQAGQRDAVQALWGLDVKSLASAQLALLTVNALPVTEETRHAREYTIKALQAACAELQRSAKTPRRLAS